MFHPVISLFLLKKEMELKDVSNTIISPLVKPLGFKKSGNKFILKHENYALLISPQRDQHIVDHLSVTINFSIYVNSFKKLLSGDTIIKNITQSDCLLTKRIGQIINGKDIWYDVEKNQEDLKNLSEDISNHILPLIETLSNQEKLISYLRNESGYIEQIIVSVLLLNEGKKSEAIHIYSKIAPLLNSYWLNLVEKNLPEINNLL